MLSKIVSPGSVVPYDIQSRRVHPVAGIDLAQSLNFVSEEAVGLEFLYTSLTYPKVFYRIGSRPRLEAITQSLEVPGDAAATVQRIADWVPRTVVHRMFLDHEFPGDRGASEEALIESGMGFCNEQSRVGVALAQILGIPSRLVFVESLEAPLGHVLSEMWLDGRWVTVDMSWGLLFRDAGGKPCNFVDLRRDPAAYAHMEGVLRERIAHGRELVTGGGEVGAMELEWLTLLSSPMRIYGRIGICNYFIY